MNIRDWMDFVFKTCIAVAVAFGGWYLNDSKQIVETEHTRAQQQNDDIRLIVEMVTSQDPAHRALGIAVLTAYVDIKPPRVPRQLADAVSAYTTVTKNNTDIQRQNEIISQVQKPSPRIYIQFQGANDRAAMEDLRQKMSGVSVAGSAVIMPPIEKVEAVVSAPVLKCFRKTECDNFGDTLVRALIKNGAPPATTLQPIAGFENSTSIRANHFEAWFGPRSSG